MIPTLSLAWRLCFWVLLAQRNALQVVVAQKRGPINIYLVNDSDEPLTAVWLNQLRIENDQLIPTTTGPIQPGAIERYKAYPFDGIELHKYQDDCGIRKGATYNPNGECKSALVKVRKATGEYPTNIIILAPNFRATSEAVLNPTFLIKAMREDVPILASIRINNNSGKNVNLFWIDPKDKSLVPMSDEGEPIESNVPHLFSANIYHQFLLKEDGCKEDDDESCGMQYFRVTAKEVEITILPNFDEVQLKQLPYDPFAKFTYRPGVDLYQQCHDHVRPELHFEHPDTIMANIDRCIREHFDKVDWGFDANLQTYRDYKMEDYICDEDRMQTTSPIEIELWRNLPSEELTRTVFVLHETDSSHIHLISNFVSPEECQAMEEIANSGGGGFEHTKTKDGKTGGTKLNQVRKAKIARVDVPWDTEDHLVTKAGRRVFDYVRHIHPGLEITHEGQEPIQAIQYHGRGRNEPNPDQYRSHCDSDCNGQPVKEGQRVATMVMYCQTPEEGGHTNFRNAHVHVKPQAGHAIFFSYVNPATKEQDTGLTIHSGCPVYEGTKKIFTQWIRYGVDYENPYTDYPLVPN